MRHQQCNLSCLYCYQHASRSSQHTGNFPSVADTILYLRSFTDIKNVFIVFHGGEPLLSHQEDVRQLLEFIFASFHNTVYVQFQTNGILLDRTWLNLLGKYKNISLSVSLDPAGEKDLRFWDKYQKFRQKVINNLDTALDYISNIGVISLVHKYNQKFFEDFMDDLVSIGVPGWSINKVSILPHMPDYGISEQNYMDVLKRVCVKWIASGLFNKINIQPLASFFSPAGSKLCNFSPMEFKCTQFHTFYGTDDCDSLCDRLSSGSIIQKRQKCKGCDIFMRCGGGCLTEELSQEFCDARREFFAFIDHLKRLAYEHQ